MNSNVIVLMTVLAITEFTDSVQQKVYGKTSYHKKLKPRELFMGENKLVKDFKNRMLDEMDWSKQNHIHGRLPYESSPENVLQSASLYDGVRDESLNSDRDTVEAASNHQSSFHVIKPQQDTASSRSDIFGGRSLSREPPQVPEGFFALKASNTFQLPTSRLNRTTAGHLPGDRPGHKSARPDLLISGLEELLKQIGRPVQLPGATGHGGRVAAPTHVSIAATAHGDVHEMSEKVAVDGGYLQGLLGRIQTNLHVPTTTRAPPKDLINHGLRFGGASPFDLWGRTQSTLKIWKTVTFILPKNLLQQQILSSKLYLYKRPSREGVRLPAEEKGRVVVMDVLHNTTNKFVTEKHVAYAASGWVSLDVTGALLAWQRENRRRPEAAVQRAEQLQVWVESTDVISGEKKKKQNLIYFVKPRRWRSNLQPKLKIDIWRNRRLMEVEISSSP